MVRYKVTPPQLPPCVDRPRLVQRLSRIPVVVLAAPGGHGKTCLAAQVAEETGGPIAWFLADEMDRDRAGVVAQLFTALGTAWTDLQTAAPATLDDGSAVPVLGATLETLAGPGCLVMDDVHLLPGDVLDAIGRIAVAALPADVRLVVCTRGDVPDGLLRAEAMSRAVTLGPGELAFDEDECARMCGSRASGAEMYARTGGWPLAVALWTRDTQALATCPPEAGHGGRLAELALDDLGSDAHRLLVVLARLPRFPARRLRRLGDRYTALETFATRNSWLFTLQDGWWVPREWLRDSLTELPADQETVDAVARALLGLDEDELAAQLLLAEGRYEDAVAVVEALALEGTRRGRAAWVRALIGSVPSSGRTFTLDLLAATAAQSLSIIDPSSHNAASELTLLNLVGRAEAESEGGLLQARALLASHYRMEADPRVFTVCEQALATALEVEAPERELRGRWAIDDAPAAAEMLRFYGHALLFSDSRQSIQRGRRLVAAALDVLDAAGRPTTSLRGWSTYSEALLFLSRSGDAVRPLRLAAYGTAGLDHNDTPTRFAELATVEFFAGELAAARRTIEMARDAAARTGNRIALPPLAAVEVALDVYDHGFTPDHADRFDDVTAQLAAHRRLAPFRALIIAEFGIVLVRTGKIDIARRYLELAEPALGDSLFAHPTSFRCRRLRGLVLNAEGRHREGREVLDAVRRDAASEGRTALVELISADLGDEAGRPAPASEALAPAPPPMIVHVLAPQLSVTMDGDLVPAPRGYPAKLLALLVAANGSMTVDAAIEGLWPGADPDVGRNRLHGVLLRLRRGLGLAAIGPIGCTEGIVGLAPSPHLEIDSWRFERLASLARTRPEATCDAVAAYAGDVLSVQFAYDDTIEAYRQALRHTFLRLATALLSDPTPDLTADDLAALARRAWRAAPDDETVCLTVIRVLVRLGQRPEALELIDATARSLVQSGLDAEDFRRRALS